MLTFIFMFFLVLLSTQVRNVRCCNQVERDSLVSFYTHITTTHPGPPLNWSSHNCCQWEGLACNSDGQVTHLLLPDRFLSGTITAFLGNLSFLSYLNLSGNQFSGSLPPELFHALDNLQIFDLKSNMFTGLLQVSARLPISIQVFDVSSNYFDGWIDPLFFRQATNLISFNVSNNSFTGPIPWSGCVGSPLIEMLDFSMNAFDGYLFNEIDECSNLQVFKAGFNSLTGCLPNDLFGAKTLKEISLPNNHFSGPINDSIVNLSNLTILELHENELSGGIPHDIGLLSNLKQLQLHTNNLNGTLPPSLMNCSKLTTLILRNNQLGGDISRLNLFKLQQLQVVDVGNNSFVGNIPVSMCLCRSLTAIRLSYTQIAGEIPPCFASLTSLTHLSISVTYLSNAVGALKILARCPNLEFLFMSKGFYDEIMPDLVDFEGFNNLRALTLQDCGFRGQIPSWISKLRKIEHLSLSYNKLSGSIPTWLGDMPNLSALDLSQNFLTGNIPCEIGRLQHLIEGNTSLDSKPLALPFVIHNNQYNRIFNMPPSLRIANNSLSGNIPVELGKLKNIHWLDLSNNNSSGLIPEQLSNLVNLEKLDMSGNHLSGVIPESLANLHFLSSFSVANNDLQGEIPTGVQFDTFPAASFQGNPRLCGYILRTSCHERTQVNATSKENTNEESYWNKASFLTGYFVGLFAICITLIWRRLKN